MKKYIILFITLAAISFSFINMASAYAWNPFKSACDELSDSQKAESTACGKQTIENPVSGPSGVLMSITKAIALVAGIIAVIIIIIGGFQFVTSGGDANKAAGARRAVIYAVVGIVVIIAAQSIIAFVITRMV